VKASVTLPYVGSVPVYYLLGGAAIFGLLLRR
jgi:hypothetical protein